MRSCCQVDSLRQFQQTNIYLVLSCKRPVGHWHHFQRIIDRIVVEVVADTEVAEKRYLLFGSNILADGMKDQGSIRPRHNARCKLRSDNGVSNTNSKCRLLLLYSAYHLLRGYGLLLCQRESEAVVVGIVQRCRVGYALVQDWNSVAGHLLVAELHVAAVGIDTDSVSADDVASHAYTAPYRNIA